MGMSQSSPTLRAAAVEMLTVLLPEMARSSEASAVPSFIEQVGGIESAFPIRSAGPANGCSALQLQQLGAQDTWWLVRANIVRVAASVLDPALDDKIVKAALALASQYFKLTAAVSIQKVNFCCSAGRGPHALTSNDHATPGRSHGIGQVLRMAPRPPGLPPSW